MVVELGELLGPVLIYPKHIDSLPAEQHAERLTVRAAGDAFSVLAGEDCPSWQPAQADLITWHHSWYHQSLFTGVMVTSSL